MDSLFLKVGSNTDLVQLSDGLDAFHRISCKSCDGFRKDQVNVPILTVCNHHLELIPVLYVSSADSFIRIHPGKLSPVVTLDLFHIVLDLCSIGNIRC